MIRRSFSHFHQQSGKLLERQRGLEDKRTQLLAQMRDLRAELEDVDQQLEIVKDQEMVSNGTFKPSKSFELTQ